jgi:hypothetical protein
VRPIVDDERGELELTAWQVEGAGWREWEHGGRLISTTHGGRIVWTGTTRGVSLTFLKDSSSGIIQVTVDGETFSMDLYSETATWQTIALPNKQLEHLAFVPSDSSDVIVQAEGKRVNCVGLTIEPSSRSGTSRSLCPGVIEAPVVIPLSR